MSRAAFRFRARDPSPEFNATPGTTFALGVGDAVFFSGGMIGVPRSEQDGTLVVLRQSILLAEAAAPLAPPATGAAPAPAQIQEGAQATVIEPDVRLRAAPSTESEIVTALQQGTVLVVAGSPEEAEGLVWVPVEILDNPQITGYVAEEFLPP